MTAPNPPGALTCDACGASNAGNAFPSARHGDLKLCDNCHKKRGIGEVLDDVTDRRRKSSEEPMPEDAFVPKVGEWCRGDGVSSGVNYTGQFIRFDGSVAKLDVGDGMQTIVTRASLRPASAQRTESEYFDAQPDYDDAPLELPAGTKTKINDPRHTIRRVKCTDAWGYKSAEEGLWYASDIDWPSVRRTPPSTETGGKAERDWEAEVVERAAKTLLAAKDPSWYAPCVHKRRFRSGLCVTCGHVGPGENDAGYAIRGEHETEPEAVARRERVARIQAVFNCPHNTNPGAYVDVGTRTCSACGISEMEFHVLRTHERRGRPNYGAGGIDRRIAAAVSECRASLETDGKARREAARHASDWDVDDAPECYSTTNSRGGR